MKKAELSMTVIVTTILLLIVLVVLSIVFQEQILSMVDSLKSLTSGITDTASDVNVKDLVNR
ncbi:hypothetical protein HYT57_02485 [Candidatus Woesearchaeota archaeon]|nr:hypothetical protein [Candidatus Woesearchaeota archaeon]